MRWKTLILTAIFSTSTLAASTPTDIQDPIWSEWRNSEYFSVDCRTPDANGVSVFCESERIDFLLLEPDSPSTRPTEVVVRNVGHESIHIDPLQVHLPLVFVWNDGLVSWSPLEVLRKANGDACESPVLRPGDEMRLLIPWSDFLVKTDDGWRLRFMGGYLARFSERFRIGLMYSLTPWTCVERPHGARLSMSEPFTVKGTEL